jgi:hypothetical protein
VALAFGAGIARGQNTPSDAAPVIDVHVHAMDDISGAVPICPNTARFTASDPKEQGGSVRLGPGDVHAEALSRGEGRVHEGCARGDGAGTLNLHEFPANRTRQINQALDLWAIRGHQEFRSFLFSSLEGQGAPQNSFVSIKLIVSIPTAPTKTIHSQRLILAFNNSKPFNNN